MPDAIRNNRLVQSLSQDLVLNQYSSWHEPFGDFGIWNGQFEQTAPIGAEVLVLPAALAVTANQCPVAGETFSQTCRPLLLEGPLAMTSSSPSPLKSATTCPEPAPVARTDSYRPSPSPRRTALPMPTRYS